jgi:hypothetical protein
MMLEMGMTIDDLGPATRIRFRRSRKRPDTFFENERSGDRILQKGTPRATRCRSMSRCGNVVRVASGGQGGHRAHSSIGIAIVDLE